MRTKVDSGDSATWKCPACGADNDISQKICDGCGDRRPKPIPSSVFPEVEKEELKPPAPEPKISSEDFEKPFEKPLEKLDEKLEGKVEKDADNEAVVSIDEEVVENVDDEIVEEKDDEEEATPEISIKDFEEAPATPSTLSVLPTLSAPSVEPSRSLVGQHYYFVFINTPAPSMIKSKVALDFEDFPVISIGRNPENLVVVPDAEVSRKHAQIEIEGNRMILSDLKSSNGTFVYDGKEFKRVNDSVEVKPNTIIKFGINTIVRLTSE